MGTKSNTDGVPGIESTEEDHTEDNQTGTSRHKQLQHAKCVRKAVDFVVDVVLAVVLIVVPVWYAVVVALAVVIGHVYLFSCDQ